MKISSKVYWYNDRPSPLSRPMVGDLKTSVVVVGGGVTGLSCAQTFNAAGVPVVLLERDFCGAGASGKTSGFVTPDSEIELSSLLSHVGPKKAKKLWEFALSGVEQLRRDIETHKLSCDYQTQDSLFVANSSKGFQNVQKEHQARAQLGYPSRLFDADAVRELLGTTQFAGAVQYPQTFGMNSYLYCQGMKKVLKKAGVQIFENSGVKKIEGQKVITQNGTVTARHIFVCTDRFIPEFDVLKKEIYHVQTFLGVTKPLKLTQVKTLFPQSPLMVWDTDLVYNYFRLTGDHRLLIGGGDLFYTYAHELSTETQRFAQRLEAYIHYKFPGLDFELESVWPGMLGVSKDLLPVVQPDKNNKSICYIGAATGLPWASALGRYAADRVLKNRHDFDRLFSSDRPFALGSRVQTLLGTPITYALSHGIAKYF